MILSRITNLNIFKYMDNLYTFISLKVFYFTENITKLLWGEQFKVVRLHWLTNGIYIDNCDSQRNQKQFFKTVLYELSF